MQAYAIAVGVGCRPGHSATLATFTNFGELHRNKLIGLESLGQISQILLFILLVVNDFLRSASHFTLTCLYHFTSDDEGIIAEYLLQVLHILSRIGGSKTVAVLKDLQLALQINHIAASLHTFIKLRVENETKVCDGSALVELNSSLSVFSLVRITVNGKDNQRNLAHHKAVLQSPATFNNLGVVYKKVNVCPKLRERFFGEIIHGQRRENNTAILISSHVNLGKNPA